MEQRVAEYKIVAGDPFRDIGKQSYQTLEQKVNALIRQGWQPLGGVAICDGGQFVITQQAMVR